MKLQCVILLIVLCLLFLYNDTMNEYLKVTSFNCNSFKSSIDAVQMLCKENDILLLQETWLLENEIG